MLQIYNSLTRQKEIFNPITPGNVTIYVCGQTVYDFCHLGHARTMIAFDVVVRYLKFIGYEVNYVRNITDVDDKIIARANENGEPIDRLTERVIKSVHEDSDALGLLRPNEEPRATAFIDQIIKMIEAILANGYGYVGANGDVYFDVRRFPAYGKLSGRNLDELESGARVDVAADKHDPLDFVLWKLAKPGEPSWHSPWGEGRPGWHIECSAMSTHCLAPQIDIHGGGKDLIFPHHENELAQSEAAMGHAFVNYWMHGGHLQVDKVKMSKSLGNFFTIRDVLKKYSPEVIRFFVSSSHYRSQLNYSEGSLQNAKEGLTRLYLSLQGLNIAPSFDPACEYVEQFKKAMDDDFNTPKALAVMFDISKEINKLKDKDKLKSEELAACLKGLGSVLGMLQSDPEEFLKAAPSSGMSDDEVNSLIEERNQARADKNWKRADEIRDQLQAEDIILEDAAGKTTWRRD